MNDGLTRNPRRKLIIKVDGSNNAKLKASEITCSFPPFLSNEVQNTLSSPFKVITFQYLQTHTINPTEITSK